MAESDVSIICGVAAVPAMKPLDFIATAKDLAAASGTIQPRETNLRRAVSTAYYAVFHCLSECCAEMLIGRGAGGWTRHTWQLVYRWPDHKLARERLESRKDMEGFSDEIQKLAEVFIDLQKKRHRADYDPAPLLGSISTVRADISKAESAIRAFSNVPEVERRAFAVHLLKRPRKD